MASLETKDFDYIRCTFPDFHGAARARIVPARHADRVLQDGWGVYEGILYTGPRSELPTSLLQDHYRRLGNRLANMEAIPDPSTLHALPWAGNNQYKVGEVFCDLVTKDGKSLATAPRYMAQKQLKELDRMGLQLMSSFELEFILEDRKTKKPVFDGNDIFSTLVFAEQEKLMFQLDQQMLQAGVDCEMLQTEASPGQFEVTMIPVYGIDGGDKAMILKQGIKEIAHQYGLEANFMAKPDNCQVGSGAHFNFSVWKKDENTNVFYDADNHLKLSTFGRHWIGGIMHHGNSLCALMNPTTTCYRRLKGPWVPNKVSWGMENRNAALRVKTGSPNTIYMENRLPSGSVNHYLVLAATIAAGLDGVRNCLQPPPEGVESPLPKTLAEALCCLEKDSVLVEALGTEFVEWFCLVKRKIDLEVLKDRGFPQGLNDKERFMYNCTI